MQRGESELVDVVDAEGRPTGEVRTRREVHHRGLWHRAIHIWVVRTDGLVLLQRRSLAKQFNPGKLDVSVGGHYRAGEHFIEVLREAEEELGLTLRPGQLAYLGTARSERRHEHEGSTFVDRELQEVYVATDDRPLDEYVLRPAEVDTLYEVPIDQAVALFERGSYTAAAGYDSMRRPSHALLIEADLPDQGRELHLAALKRVKAWLEGAPAEELSADLEAEETTSP